MSNTAEIIEQEKPTIETLEAWLSEAMQNLQKIDWTAPENQEHKLHLMDEIYCLTRSILAKSKQLKTK